AGRRARLRPGRGRKARDRKASAWWINGLKNNLVSTKQEHNNVASLDVKLWLWIILSSVVKLRRSDLRRTPWLRGARPAGPQEDRPPQAAPRAGLFSCFHTRSPPPVPDGRSHGIPGFFWSFAGKRLERFITVPMGIDNISSFALMADPA